MNIVGIICILFGWFLDELYGGNSWLSITGLILWMIGEGQMLRSLKDEFDAMKENRK
jgi:F0F1-type ATP synthase assembly protein I